MGRLRSRAMFAFVLAAAFAAAAGGARAEGVPTAIVVSVAGDVGLRKAGERSFSPAAASTLLYSGDALQTGAGAAASVALRFGSEVRVNENSVLEILSGQDGIDSVSLAGGQVWTRMLHRKAKLDVRTPPAVCAIRGTEADIEQKDLLTVKVYEGHVEVSNTAGKQSLKAGQMSTVAGPASAPAKPKRIGKGEEGTWQNGIDAANAPASLDKLRAAAGMKGVKLKVIRGGKSRELDIKAEKK